MKVCISEATTMPATFLEDVNACAASSCGLMEVWLTKLEDHLKSHSPDETRSMLADRGVSLAAASYQGGLLLSQGAARKEHYEQFRGRLQLCEAFGIPTMLIAADFVGRIEPTDIERAIVSLTQAAQWAAGFGVRIALEFRAADSFCTCLETAVNLALAAAEPNVGVALDAFHFFKGPSKAEDLNLLTAENLAFVQISDWAGTPRELVSDSDRIMPGDGDLPLTPWLQALQDRGYRGPISLELMNPMIWQMKAVQVMEIGVSAVQRVLPPAPPLA